LATPRRRLRVGRSHRASSGGQPAKGSSSDLPWPPASADVPHAAAGDMVRSRPRRGLGWPTECDPHGRGPAAATWNASHWNIGRGRLSITTVMPMRNGSRLTVTALIGMV